MMKTWIRTLSLLFLVILLAGCTANSTPHDPENNQNEAEDGVKDEQLNPNDNEASDEETGQITQDVTLYFSDEQLMNIYKVEKEITVESEADLPKTTLQEWIAGPDIEGLQSILPVGVKLYSVTIEDKVATVDFSKEIMDANLGSTGEMFLFDQIALTMKQFGADSIQLLVEGKIESTLFGHISADRPYSAPDPEQYDFYQAQQ